MNAADDSLLNPFTPSEIAATPDQFFGRELELQQIEAALARGSVLIQGPVGIGKSSLVSRALDIMAGFDSSHHCEPVVIVSDKEVDTVQKAARLVTDRLLKFGPDERRATLKFGLETPVGEASVEIGGETVRHRNEGQHLAVLKTVLESDHKRRRAQNRELLLIAIDEADKSPVPIARLVRAITTDMQQVGVRDVRFVIAGVSPVYQELLDEDSGLSRSFNRVLTLAPMSADDAHALLVRRFSEVTRAAAGRNRTLEIDPDVIERVAALSGGHPHVLQLLGSHLIEQENEHQDGIIDANDLVGCLGRVCHEDRGAVYAATLHMMENAGQLGAFTSLISAPIASPGFPTVIDRPLAVSTVGESAVQWLIEHDVLVVRSPAEYGLVDEFLRVRVVLDASEPARRDALEREMAEQGRLISVDELLETFEEGGDRENNIDGDR